MPISRDRKVYEIHTSISIHVTLIRSFVQFGHNIFGANNKTYGLAKSTECALFGCFGFCKMLTHSKLGCIKIVKICASRIGGSFSKKFFLRTNCDCNLSAWHALPENRNVVAAFDFTLINRDGWRNENAAYVGSGAGSYAYRKS